jgi:pimeloyl-ACP methyl ester carboxylesterase
MLVLLVHGLGRTPLSMFGLASTLRRAGHHTRFFGYSATFESLPRIVRRLSNRLQSLAKMRRPVGLVGHSLGGLLLRMALVEVPNLAVHHFVMLGTPNCGSRMAGLASRWSPFRIFSRSCGQFLSAPSECNRVSRPCIPFTVIVGTAGPKGRYSPFGNEPNDGVVAVSEAAIDALAVVQFPVLHSFMMDSPSVRSCVIAAFDRQAT